MRRRIAERLVFTLCAASCSLMGLAGAPAPSTPPASAPAAPQVAAPATPPGPTPQIKFDATEVNLGEVVKGQDAVATFTYRNLGRAPLRIISAKPG